MREDGTATPGEGGASSGLTVDRKIRSTLYEVAVARLARIGDIYIALNNGDAADALRLRRLAEVDMCLLDDLGWQRETTVQTFELTMPTSILRPLLDGIYWESVASLSDEHGDLLEEAERHLRSVVALCPALLCRLAEAEQAHESHGDDSL
jgi:hypothetical protein